MLCGCLMISYGGEDWRWLMFWPWFSGGAGVGYCNASMTLTFGGVRGPCEKCWPDWLLYATIFERVLDIIRIKIRHLNSENKWKSFQYSIQIDWKLRAKSNKLMFSRTGYREKRSQKLKNEACIWALDFLRVFKLRVFDAFYRCLQGQWHPLL